jgi:hypothetical protein
VGTYSIRWILDLIPKLYWPWVGIKNRNLLKDLLHVFDTQVDDNLFQELNSFAGINYED